jgi:hypothetical protein
VKDQADHVGRHGQGDRASAAQDAKEQATSPSGPPPPAGDPTVTIVVEEDVAPASDYTSGRVPPRPTL